VEHQRVTTRFPTIELADGLSRTARVPLSLKAPDTCGEPTGASCRRRAGERMSHAPQALAEAWKIAWPAATAGEPV
jgi:hypothetical protein